MPDNARRLTRLRRDVRRATARAVGCRPRDVVLTCARRAGVR